VGHRVAELHVVDALDVRGDEADLAGPELLEAVAKGWKQPISVTS